jgi:hypothetical protein
MEIEKPKRSSTMQIIDSNCSHGSPFAAAVKRYAVSLLLVLPVLATAVHSSAQTSSIPMCTSIERWSQWQSVWGSGLLQVRYCKMPAMSGYGFSWQWEFRNRQDKDILFDYYYTGTYGRERRSGHLFAGATGDGSLTVQAGPFPDVTVTTVK